MVKGAGYVRVSTENQMENYSIDAQTERLKAYCKAKDIHIVKIYTDGGYSGGNTNRPALQQMLRDIEHGIIDTVIVYKLDRLSRSQKDTLTLIEDCFLAHNVDFISINENFDTSTPFGRAMIGILSVFAQLEKDQITERFTMGRIGRAKSGYYHGGPTPPTGYDYVDGKLVINEYEAMQVRELYQRFLKGYSVYDCWKYMSRRYTTKYGGWKSETLIRGVLRNDVYIGNVKFMGKSYPGIHQPIISADTFRQVQEIFDSSGRKMKSPTRSPFKASTLLSGLIYCGKCGARYHGEHGNYSCYSRTKGDAKYIIDPNCRNRKWKITELDKLVTDYISKLNFSSLKPAPAAEPEPEIDYAGRIDAIEQQIGKLIDLYQVDGISIEMVSQKIKTLSQEKKALEEAASKPAPVRSSLDEMILARDTFLALIEKGPLEEKRACLSMLIERITIDDVDVDIKLRKI